MKWKIKRFSNDELRRLYGSNAVNRVFEIFDKDIMIENLYNQLKRILEE